MELADTTLGAGTVELSPGLFVLGLFELGAFADVETALCTGDVDDPLGAKIELADATLGMGTVELALGIFADVACKVAEDKEPDAPL